MSLRLRFLLSLFAVLALMAGPAVFAANRVSALRDIVVELRGQAAEAALATGRLEAALVQLDRHQRAYVITTDAELLDSMHDDVQQAVRQVATLRGEGYNDLLDGAGIRVGHLARLNDTIRELVEREQLDSASDFLRDVAAPDIDRIRAGVPPLAAAIDARTRERTEVAQRAAIAAATATTAALIIAALFAFALAFAAAGVLTQPVDRLRRAMSRVADGTFETPDDLPYDRLDEVGELSRSFRTMTLRLAEFDRLRAEFVGSASHDLKTPVSIILGYAEMVQDELHGPEHARQRDLLRSLSDQALAIQRRVDQLLEISRMEAGRVRLGLEQINARHFMTEVTRAFEPAARRRELSLELHVHDDVPHFITADPDVLRADVLDNVLGNAIRFTPPGGSIRIALRPDGDVLTIEIADTGCGIPEDQLEHIFEKYYQGRGANAGAGLGLAIAKAGITAHAGRIDVWSRPQRGTRVRLSLPIRSALDTHAAPPLAATG